MTNIVQYGGWKYGNPVVRPDGRMVAAQVGSADVVDAGVGQGIVLMDLARTSERFRAGGGTGERD